MKKFILSLVVLSFSIVAMSAVQAPEVKNKEYTDKEGNIVRISIIDKIDIHDKVSDEDAPKLILYTVYNNLLKKYPDLQTLEKKKVDDQYIMLLKVEKEGQQTMTAGYMSYLKNDKIVTIGYIMPSTEGNDVEKIESNLIDVRANLE